MKKSLCCAAAVLLVASAVAEEKLAEFRSEAGNFSVHMPGKPAEQKQSADTPGGVIETRRFVVRSEQVLYLVSYTDYPTAAVKEAGPEALLAAARDGLAETVKGEVKTEKKSELQGNPGLEFSIEGQQSQRFSVREYLVKNRLYQVVAGGSAEKLGSEPVKGFLASFKLLK